MVPMAASAVNGSPLRLPWPGRSGARQVQPRAVSRLTCGSYMLDDVRRPWTNTTERLMTPTLRTRAPAPHRGRARARFRRW
ncbi:hypothetical protein GCM10025789_19230 [Tessaracoccus lubricantis]|uniref:Uncharacterized protein n=1 Tax=Tessaracoccus lubricantis TaxID=545543 RepID=A0ABP9FFS1_9ACTN